jgi:hypothetical protein
MKNAKNYWQRNRYCHFLLISLLLLLAISAAALAQSVDPLVAPKQLAASSEQRPTESQQQQLVLQKAQMQQEKNQLVSNLKQLKLSDFANYLDEVKQIRKSVQLFIKNKKKECLGDFASIVLNDAGESELVKRKLTKEEKKFCLHELKSFNAFYIGRIFDSKKEYLNKVYQKQISAIEVVKDELLEEMENRFKEIEKQQSGRRPRRKSRSKRR